MARTAYPLPGETKLKPGHKDGMGQHFMNNLMQNIPSPPALKRCSTNVAIKVENTADTDVNPPTATTNISQQTVAMAASLPVVATSDSGVTESSSAAASSDSGAATSSPAAAATVRSSVNKLPWYNKCKWTCMICGRAFSSGFWKHVQEITKFILSLQRYYFQCNKR